MRKVQILKKNDLNFLKEIKSLIILSFLLLISSIISGFLFFSINPESGERVLKEITFFTQTIGNLNHVEQFGIVFLNNALKIFVVAISGLAFAIVPIFFLIINGFIIGFAALLAQNSSSWDSFWLGILPHGIFEILALILGISVGLHLGKISVEKFFKKANVNLRAELKKSLSLFLGVIIPLLFFSAFVEIYITQYFISIIK